MFTVGPTFFSGEATFAPVLTPGSEATIASPASTTWVGAVPLSASKAIVMYSAAGQPLRAIVADVAGTVITPATAVSVEATWCVMAKAVALSSTDVLVVYTRQSDGALRAVVLSVSGSTITVNTAVTLVMGSTALAYFSIALIDSTHAVVGKSNSPGGYDFMVVTISGTTVTANTVYTHATVGNPSLAAPYLALLSSTEVAVVYRDRWTVLSTTADGARGMVLSVSGTTITLPVGPQDLIHQYAPFGAHQHCMRAVSSSRVAFVLPPNAGGVFTAMQYDIAGGLFTPVGGVAASTANALVGSAQCFDVSGVTASGALVITVDSPNQDLASTPLHASGAGPVIGSRVVVRDNPSPLTYPAAASLSATKKLVAYTDSASVYGIVFDVT